MIINLCNSPYSRGIIEKKRCGFGHWLYVAESIVFVNNVGAQTDIVYDGSSGIINSRGEAVTLLKSFSEDFRIIELDADHEPVRLPEQNKTVNVYHAIKLGLQDYFAKNGFKTACLGLSGGIDSAVVVSLAAEALGPENVRVLLMPSQFSSDHSVEDARALAENLGIEYQVVPINETFAALTTTLGPVFGELPFDVTEENMQSRIRGMMMMAISNKFGNILLATSIKKRDRSRLRNLARRYGRSPEHHRRPVQKRSLRPGALHQPRPADHPGQHTIVKAPSRSSGSNRKIPIRCRLAIFWTRSCTV